MNLEPNNKSLSFADFLEAAIRDKEREKSSAFFLLQASENYLNNRRKITSTIVGKIFQQSSEKYCIFYNLGV